MNSAKYEVLGKLEEELPARLFKDEWLIAKRDPLDQLILRYPRMGRFLAPLARYPELSLIEQVVPAVFFVLFAVTLAGA